MSREEEIRERLEAVGELDQWYSADEATESLEYAGVDADALGPDADLIANAPVDLAYLLERNAELEATVRAVEDIHFNEDHVCGQCANKYPCETIRAIRAHLGASND